MLHRSEITITNSAEIEREDKGIKTEEGKM